MVQKQQKSFKIQDVRVCTVWACVFDMLHRNDSHGFFHNQWLSTFCSLSDPETQFATQDSTSCFTTLSVSDCNDESVSCRTEFWRLERLSNSRVFCGWFLFDSAARLACRTDTESFSGDVRDRARKLCSCFRSLLRLCPWRPECRSLSWSDASLQSRTIHRTYHPSFILTFTNGKHVTQRLSRTAIQFLLRINCRNVCCVRTRSEGLLYLSSTCINLDLSFIARYVLEIPDVASNSDPEIPRFTLDVDLYLYLWHWTSVIIEREWQVRRKTTFL